MWYATESEFPTVHGTTHEFLVGGESVAQINTRLDGTLYCVDSRGEVCELGSGLQSAQRRVVVDAIAVYREAVQAAERWLEETDSM